MCSIYARQLQTIRSRPSAYLCLFSFSAAKASRWPLEIPSADRGHAVEMHLVVPTTEEAPAVVVEKVSPRLHWLLVATTAHRFGDPPRDRRHGGPDATTTDGPRDGSSRAGEIALMMVHGATIECTSPEATSDNSVSRIAATTTKKLRCINKSSGGNRSPAAARRRKRF